MYIIAKKLVEIGKKVIKTLFTSHRMVLQFQTCISKPIKCLSPRLLHQKIRFYWLLSEIERFCSEKQHPLQWLLDVSDQKKQAVYEIFAIKQDKLNTKINSRIILQTLSKRLWLQDGESSGGKTSLAVLANSMYYRTLRFCWCVNERKA